MAKMGCAKCGKSMSKGGVKKMAKGGTASVNISKPGAGYAKAQKGGDNQKNFIYGIPTTNTANAGIATMKKGGAMKAKFGASVSVQRSPKAGKIRSASAQGYSAVGKREPARIIKKTIGKKK